MVFKDYSNQEELNVSKKYNFEIDGKKFEVEVELSSSEKADAIVNGKKFEINIDDPSQINKIIPSVNQEKIKVSPEKLTQHSSPTSRGDLKALMPGKIIKVLVSEGQKVKMGDPVLIMESMKMEQTIVATSTGTIERIEISKGDTVETGFVMMIIQ